MTDSWAIVLAAGAGTRFGGCKPLASWQGTTLLGNALAIARAVCGGNVIVVTGAQSDALTPHLIDTRTVHNAHWPDGMGGSIACGVAALAADAAAALILPIDQPLIVPAHCLALLADCHRTGQAVLTRDADRIGPPAAVPARLFGLACQLTGEGGLKSILSPGDLRTIANAAALRDADTPGELRALPR